MSNVYPFEQTCSYYLGKAARYRDEGRYDKSMRLIAKARQQFGPAPEIEFAAAKTYDEMGCEEDACRCYLRVARSGSPLRSQALFALALTSAQNDDLKRAQSYFLAFSQTSGEGVCAQMAQLLDKQLREAMHPPAPKTKRQFAKSLSRRAGIRLREGKLHAALRNIDRAIALDNSYRNRLLKCCCLLVLGEYEESVRLAQSVLSQGKARIQSLCLLSDALHACGREKEGKRCIFLAAAGARSFDLLVNTAVEAAKHGYHKMTLAVTRRILKRDPYHVKALAMRACAFANLGQKKQAARLFASLCTLMPENTVYSALFLRMKENGEAPSLTLAQDVDISEAVERSTRLISLIKEEPAEIRSSSELLREICSLSAWALRSPMTGENIRMIAVIMLSALDTPQTCDTLFDAVLDPDIDDALKSRILEAMAAYCSSQPVYADWGGRFVRIAAGASASVSRENHVCQSVVKRAADALIKSYPSCAKTLIHMWIRCIEKYGAVPKRHFDVCAGALEYAFHLRSGRRVSLRKIAGKYGVSRRLCGWYARKILRACEDA